MIVEKHKAVSINYVVYNDNDEMIDSTQNHGPLMYLHGASNILAVLEKALEGKTQNSRVRVSVPPTEGYGEYIEEMAQSIPLSEFPDADKIKVGVQFQLDTPQGPRIATITAVEDETFTLDMNHPMAGMTLHFDIEVADIRDATPQEIEQGQIYSAGCGCGQSHEQEGCGCEHKHEEGCGCGQQKG